MDAIFKALNDPARRALLDELRRKDGQTLTQLEEKFEMTRFGVMKHLKVLEEAHLILVRREGRFKYHYLNVLPLQEMVDRWIDPLLQGPASALSTLKTRLEDTAMSKPDFMMQTYIRCTRDALWDALTDPVQVSAYHFMSEDARREGDTLVTYLPDGTVMLRERRIKLDPKSRIEATFEPQWDEGIPASKTVMLIDVEGGHCRLTVEHYDLAFPVIEGEGIADGWQRWAAGLKTWLETGETVRFADAEAHA